MKRIDFFAISDELDLLPHWVRSGRALNYAVKNEKKDTSLLVSDTVLPADSFLKKSEVRDQLINISHEKELESLQKIVSICENCTLCHSRVHTVFGYGSASAKWLFVGEAPGEHEDRLGKPFVGMAGKLLDNMLFALGMNRDHDVYITNVVKCRPPGNRDPSLDEVSSCHLYLDKQIKLINPKIIVALGRFAAQNLIGSQETISRLRLREHFYSHIPVIVTYHPAYLLRNLQEKSKAWEDLLYAKNVFSKCSSARTRSSGVKR